LSNKTILFADDSATMRTIMEKTFAAEPFDVVSVPSGEAAIAKAKEVGPQIVIADAGMAGVSGYDVCKALRDDAALGAVPVIIMSGVSAPYDEAKGREVGATEHVKKPFDTAKLIEKVEELTAGVEAPAAAAPAPEPPAAAAPAPAAAEPVKPQAPVAPMRPKPDLSPKPPVTPATRQQPPKPVVPTSSGPVAGPSTSGKSIKATMEFTRPGAIPEGLPKPPSAPEPKPEPEVKPIELDEPAAGEGDEAIQVGTLAELAQMDERGGHIKPDVETDAIELEDKPPAPEPTPPAETVKREAAAAGAEIAARTGGLTPEQAEAIQRLTADVIERIVWEVVPDLAETMIREQLDKLLEE
jgi:CheY-like chemotaxis protein